jgi:yecA family protein
MVGIQNSREEQWTMKAITKNEVRILTSFLGSPKRPTGTLRFHELQGFLFTIASSPETISTSDWLPMISDEQDFSFGSESEAQQILNAIMALYNEVNTGVLKRSENLPRGCSFAANLDASFGEDSSICQWSRGFLVGHDWLADVWEDYLIEEMEDQCGATLMVLSLFSSRRLAEAYFDDGKPTRKNPDKSFGQFAETIQKLFPSAMTSYAQMGRKIFEALLEMTDSGEPGY